MKHAFIYNDYVGMPNRTAILKRACEECGVAFKVVSTERGIKGAEFVEVPREWLPLENNSKRNPVWWRGHLPQVIGASLMPGYDHYWCVEYDVSASPETWVRLLNQTADVDADGLSGIIHHRSESKVAWFNHPTTPPDFDWFWHPCIMRLSSRAVQWLIDSAEETREVFIEVCVPSIIARNEGTMRKLNSCGDEPFCHPCTLKFNTYPSPPVRNDRRLRHPVKTDDVLVSETKIKPTNHDHGI